MVRKKAKTTGASTSSTWDITPCAITPTFMTDTAQKRFHEYLSNRAIFQERSLIVILGRTPQSIASQKAFVEQSQLAILPLVREFYVNILDHSHYKVKIRGIDVPFTDATIAKNLSVEYLSNDDCHNWQPQGDEWDTIRTTLCTPEIQWTIQNNRYHSLPYSMLKSELKLWFHFIVDRIMPTTHTPGTPPPIAPTNDDIPLSCNAFVRARANRGGTDRLRWCTAFAQPSHHNDAATPCYGSSQAVLSLPDDPRFSPWSAPPSAVLDMSTAILMGGD
ncbi:hypothetical protein BUALT_Bualt06G0058400 [Buddleja alternifolia]|uniref:Putative plant transposon protein domain-containing protein n=1 Tax=Buddleja alternifolia TaxID=168488 RepID=A0AAV6XD91_9LAMI|nr:hypothetical protein BUALT_Bualt06G0058400 [Buddleja alternifolia]